jgi:hypothetical protein
LDDSGRRYRRKRTGRKYVIGPPPPLSPIPLFLLAILGVIGVLQAFLSNYPLPWGIVAGVSILGVLYLLVRSMVPVKHYRPIAPAVEGGRGQPAPAPQDRPRPDSNS